MSDINFRNKQAKLPAEMISKQESRHECEGWIAKSVLRITDGHHKPSASCNSASGRPRHLGVIVLTILQTSMK